MTIEKNKKISIRHHSATWFLVFLMAGLFLFGKNVLAVGDYNKVDGSRLNPDEWNNLVNDYVTTWATSTMAGPLGIGTAPSSALDIFGKLKFTSGGTIYNTDSTRYLDMTGILTDSLRVSGDLYSTAGELKIAGTGISYLMGNVGIGTTGPGNLLHVRGNLTTAGTSVNVARFDGGSTVPAGGLIFTSYYTDATRLAGIQSIDRDGNYRGLLLNAAGGYVGIGTNNPISKLDLVGGNFDLDNTTFANQNGMITKNGTRFISDFNYGNNGTVTTAGGNIFIGASSGNLSMGSTAISAYQASYNSAFGDYTLANNTIGYQNAAFGRAALNNNTSGYSNSAFGSDAGRYIADGSTANQSSYNSTYIGFSTKALANGDTNETAIGYGATGIGSNSVVLGNDSVTKTALKGNVGIGTTTPITAKLVVVPSGSYSIDANNGRIGNVGSPVMDSDAATVAYVKSIAAGTSTVPTVGYWTANGNNIYSANSGNVGVGTTNPETKLFISGSDGTSTGLTIARSNFAGGSLSIYERDTETNFLHTEDATDAANGHGEMIFSTNAAEGVNPTNGGFRFKGPTNTFLRILNNGNVGIGTTNPGAKLHIVDTGDSKDLVDKINGGLTIQSNTGSRSMTNGAQLEFAIPANSDGSNLFGQGRILTVAGNTSTGNATGMMIFGTRRYFNKLGTGSDWYYGDDITINGSGNVGIGTTTPAYKLDVAGTGQFTQPLIVGTPTAANHAITKSYFDSAIGDPVGAGTAGQTLRNDGNGWVANSTLFNNGNNVGIGTTAPGAKLHISGTIGSTIGGGGSSIKMTNTDTGNYASIGAGIVGSYNDGMDFSVDGSRAMVIRSGGNIGINTTAPAYKLDVNGTAQFTQPVIVGTPTATNHAATKSYVDSAAASAAGASWTVNGANIYNSNSGNVGIGITNPLAKLHVVASTGLASTTASSQILTRIAGSTSNNFMENTWLYRDSAGTDWGTARIHNGISIDSSFLTPGVDTRTWWERDPNNNIQSWGNAASTYLTINAGNVGIGTTNPGYKLEVVGNGRFTSVGSQLRLTYAGGAYPNFDFSVNSNGDLTTTGGNVGIGTTAPSYKLDVAGTGQFTQPLIVGTPTAANHAITKSYFDSAIGDPVSAGAAGQTLRNDGNGWVANSTLFNDGNNVGIGTTVPASQLHINNGGDINTGFIKGIRLESSARSYQISSGVQGVSNAYFGIADVTGDAYRLVITDAGNVGIGTIAPSYKLDVSGTGQFTQPLIVGTPTADSHAATKSYVDSAAASAAGASWTVSGNNIYNSNLGNVGIGTTAPGKKLTVSASDSLGMTSSNTSVVRLVNPDTTLGAFTGIQFNHLNDVNAQTTAMIGAVLTDRTSTWASDLVFGTKSGIYATDVTEYMRIKMGGNVGIGTTNPSQKLSVNGNLSIGEGTASLPQIIMQNDGWNVKNYIGMTYSGDTIQLGANGAAVSSVTANLADTSNGSFIQSLAPAYYKIQYAAAGTNPVSLNTALYINSSGNVGIGTTAPSYKLDVAGTGQFTQPLIVGTPTADSHAATKSYVDSAAGGGIGAGTAGQTLRNDGNGWVANSTLYNNGTNIGIGTTTPASKLTVVGDIRHTGFMMSQGANYASYWMKFDQDVNGNSLILGAGGLTAVGSGESADAIRTNVSPGTETLYLSSDNNISFQTNLQNGWASSTNAMNITNVGNVGIGSAAPAYTLDVAGTGRFTQPLIVGTPTADSHAATKSYVDSVAASAAGASWTVSGNNIYNSNLGNVGIGTTNPVAKLNVDGNIVQTIYHGNNMQLWFPASRNGGGTGDASLYLWISEPNTSWTGGGIARNMYNASGFPRANTSLPGQMMHFTEAGNIEFVTENSDGVRNTPLTALNNGNVGIGNTAPSAALDIFSKLKLTSGGTIYNADSSRWLDMTGILTDSLKVSGDLYSTAGELKTDGTGINYMMGNVGVGTTNPANKVSVFGDIGVGYNTVMSTSSSGYLNLRLGVMDSIPTNTTDSFIGVNSGISGMTAGDLLLMPRSSVAANIRMFTGSTVPTERLTILNSGNVGIGTTSPTEAKLVINAGTGMALKAYGNGIFTGTLQTQTGSDFAEEFVTSDNLEPGTVVVMDDNGHKSVKPCAKSYDKTVVGIVSNNPSIIAGRVNSEHKAIIAMMGVVKVKVSNINGNISKGDLLTTSGIYGYAMKANDTKPGTVIGKALENLNKATGEINVLVNLQ